MQVSLLHNFPYPGEHQAVLDAIATSLLVVNIVLFTALSGVTATRYWMYPETWSLMIHHPVQSLYIGCFPMAFATIINGLVIEANGR